MQKKYKIAIISQSCPPLGGGGVNSAHYNLCLALHNLGYPVALFTVADTQKHTSSDLFFIHRFCLPRLFKKIITFLCKIYFGISDPHKMYYQVQDILFCQWGAFLSKYSLKKFNPDILILPDRGCPGFSIRKIGHEKTILICHHNPARFSSPLLFDKEMSQLDIKQAINIEKYASQYVDAIIFPSQYMADFSKESHGYKQQTHIIYNVIDSTIIENTPKKNIKGIDNTDALVIYIPSGGSQIKGGRYLFEIVRRIFRLNKKVFFYISGDVSESLRTEFKLLGLDKNIFSPGTVNYSDNISYMKSCSLCISPTLLENFSMALFEAQYCGLPTICFDCGGNKEIVKDKYTGYLVPLLDIDSIIEKVTILLKDPQKLKELSINSKKHSQELLKKSGIEHYVTLFDSLYQ